jgi:hypothetical protein
MSKSIENFIKNFKNKPFLEEGKIAQKLKLLAHSGKNGNRPKLLFSVFSCQSL